MQCKEEKILLKVLKVYGRDASLFLFRSLGKILYGKRETSQEEIERSVHKNRQCNTLICNPEEVFDRTQIASDTFNLYLHQNYLNFFSSIDQVCEAAEYLSDADLITGA